MKINVYYEDKNRSITLDVPDNECEIWIETDYRRRLSEANTEDRPAVIRRSAQEIMDEECNKPTFNNNHAETHRHVSLNALDPEDKHLSTGSTEIESIVIDNYPELHDAINQLKPKQRDLVYKMFFECIKQTEIAESEGVTESAITQRMDTALRKLKKILGKNKFSF